MPTLDHENILRLHSEGLSAAEIARLLGSSRNAVCTHLQAEGIHGKQYGYVKEYTLTSSASLRFAELIAPYMHKDLMYKLPSNRPRRKIAR